MGHLAGLMRVVYWVNVSESSGIDSPGLSRIKGCQAVVADVDAQ